MQRVQRNISGKFHDTIIFDVFAANSSTKMDWREEYGRVTQTGDIARLLWNFGNSGITRCANVPTDATLPNRFMASI